MGDSLTSGRVYLPPGSVTYNPSDDFFVWLNENFSRYGALYRADVFGRSVYVVSNPDYCERILRRNWRNYARSGQVVKRIALLLGNGLIASNGEFWANQRRMIQPAFSKASISSFIPMVIKTNAELLQKWQLAARRRETVNVTRDTSAVVLRITLTAIFGDDAPVAARYFGMLADGAARDLEFAHSFRSLAQIIPQLIEQRRSEGKTASDFLGSMMQARDRENDAPMPDAQLAKEVMTLIVAGHETTASLLNWTWYLLSQHPAVRAKLSDELDRLPWCEAPTMEDLAKYTYLRQIIEESLRLYPPLWLMTRRAVQDDWFGEFFVPAGTEIYISPYLLQHSPHLWELPERFDPDRMTPEATCQRHELATCPFGAGPRNCIGETFARVESQIHFMVLARELWLQYENPETPEMTTGMNLLSKHDFIMQPILRGKTSHRLPVGDAGH